MQQRAELRQRPQGECSAGKTGRVLSVDIASRKAIAAATVLRGVETLVLAQALGRVCVGPVESPIDLPVFANAAMDGYALRRADLTGKGPWTLPVTGRLIGGANSIPSLVQESAMRIMTGAPMPDGADCVVMQEHCERSGDYIVVSERPERGRHVRHPGEDVRRSTVLAAAGELLTARHLSLLAACGCAELSVRERLRVGLISTGSELVEPGAPLATGQIYNSNRVYLRARLERPWIDVVDFGIVRDDANAIQTALRQAAGLCDVVITTGGVSAGEEDHMLDVLRREAAELDVLKVAMRPGKPVTVGRLGAALYVGLPGNPYACAVTYMQIAWPAIRAAVGLAPHEDRQFVGVSDFTYVRRTGRTEYLPVTWTSTDPYGRPLVERLGKGSSASLHPLALARAIAMVPPDVDTVRPGDALTLEPVDF